MESAPATPARIFLPWDRPLLPQAVELLAGGWSGGTPLDLSRGLVIVPTRQSGRRLREALAGRAQAFGQAVFPPRVHTPESLLLDQAGPAVASRLESLLAWTEVLLTLPLGDFSALFPVPPAEQNFRWAARVAREFARLHGALGDTGHGLADVGARAGEPFPETARWADLARLEERWHAALARLGRRDLRSALAAAAAAPVPAWDPIWLIGVPDPPRLAVELLQRWAGSREIRVAVFAPETEAGAFDAWGRPDPGWRRRPLDFPDFTGRVHLEASPAGEADSIAALARDYATPAGVLGIGLLGPELDAVVADALREVGREAYDPDGGHRRQGGWYHLLHTLLAFAESADFAALRQLARCPDILEFLQQRLGGAFSGGRWLAGLDALRECFLVADLPAAREKALERPALAADLAAGLALLSDLRMVLTTGPADAALRRVLGEIFSGVRWDLQSPEGQARLEAVEAWQALAAVRPPAALAGAVGRGEWWDFLLEQYGDQAVPAERPAEAVELAGWLELLWNDAPHLAVAGCNDGLLPEPVPGDSFLPETLRARLGMDTTESRHARDAYLLQALVAGRRAGGRVDLFYAKKSQAGDPLRPSRLLLQCPPEELPGRVVRLFAPPPPPGPPLAWQRAWILQVPRRPPPDRVSVTGLRRYLKCPLRFYLSQVLRLASFEPAKDEMDAVEFGTLCHAVLETAWREPGLRESTDADELRAAFWAELKRRVQRKWGGALSLPLLVQVDSARQRLAAAAELEVAERGRGWRTVEIEREIRLEFGGLAVQGRIDRVDHNVGTGAWRVLDYKTSDTPREPAKVHLRPGGADAQPDWKRFAGAEGDRLWADLQLPLYLQACAAEENWSAGYFNLPKATSQTAIALWDDFTPEHAASARACAAAACAAIRRGEFWPPNETLRPEQDEFDSLFHQGVAASVELAPP